MYRHVGTQERSRATPVTRVQMPNNLPIINKFVLCIDWSAFQLQGRGILNLHGPTCIFGHQDKLVFEESVTDLRYF